MVPVHDAPKDPRWVPGAPTYVSGAVRLGEDSTARSSAARRFRDTPMEYRCTTPSEASDRASCGRAVLEGTRKGRGLTLLLKAAYHPPDDDAPCAFERQARLRAFRG